MRPATPLRRHVVHFLLEEMASGRIPPEMLPIQAGVGNVANAVLAGLGKHPDIPELVMYTEVFQSAAFELMKQERMSGASTTALTLTPKQMADLINEIDYYAPRIVLRPQEISNNPAVVRQVGVIAMNTALEFDVYGHVNSTHVMGRTMVNGIGGSGDFARNAYLSIFMCPSTAKDGHDFDGGADVHPRRSQRALGPRGGHGTGARGLARLAPEDRAERIIDRCAHPHYREYLHQYIRRAGAGHIRHDLGRCFELHQNLLRYGSMLPDSTVPSTATWLKGSHVSPDLRADRAVPNVT